MNTETRFNILRMISMEHCTCGHCEEPIKEIDCGFFTATAILNGTGTRVGTKYERLEDFQQDENLYPYAMMKRTKLQRNCRKPKVVDGTIHMDTERVYSKMEPKRSQADLETILTAVTVKANVTKKAGVTRRVTVIPTPLSAF